MYAICYQVSLPGAVYEANLSIELIRPTIRVDKAYLMKYFGEDGIINIEYESGSDQDMALRLHAYNAVLQLDYKLPVVSLIMYPFRTKMAQSPLQVHIGPKKIIDFHFHTLALFEEDAERYVQEHITCMYPLLPTMKGANHTLIKQATTNW